VLSDAARSEMYDNFSYEFSYDGLKWLSYNEFYSGLDKEFNFTLDVCATKKNSRCAKYYTIEDNGLIQDWTGEIVYCSPWYDSNTIRWIRKCEQYIAVMMVHYEPEDSWWQNVPGAVVIELRCRVNFPNTVVHHVECTIATLVYNKDRSDNATS